VPVTVGWAGSRPSWAQRSRVPRASVAAGRQARGHHASTHRTPSRGVAAQGPLVCRHRVRENRARAGVLVAIVLSEAPSNHRVKPSASRGLWQNLRHLAAAAYAEALA